MSRIRVLRVPLSRFLLSFDSKQTANAYEQYSQQTHQKSKRRSLVLSLFVQFVICLTTMLAVGHTSSMKLLCVLSFSSFLFSFLLSICAHSQTMAYITEIVSQSCTAIVLILSHYPENTSNMQPVGINNTASGSLTYERYFIVGMSMILNLTDSGYSHRFKAIAILAETILFGATFQFSLISWIICGLLYYRIIYGMHSEERIKRIAFLELQAKKASLKQWEKLLDKFVDNPVFVLTEKEDDRALLAKRKIQVKQQSKRVSVADSSGSSPAVKKSKNKHMVALPAMSKSLSQDINSQRAEMFIDIIEGSQHKMTDGFREKVGGENEAGGGAGTDNMTADKTARGKEPALEFQNIGCQKHFYSQMNQSSLLIEQLRSVVVQNTQPQLHLQLFLGNQDEKAFSNENSREAVSLVDYLSTKLNGICKERKEKKRKEAKGRQIVYEEYTSRGNLYEESDDFEVSEIELIENCERQVSNGFGVITQTYSAHVLHVLFHGKPGIMVHLRETTKEKIVDNVEKAGQHREKLLKSLLSQAVLPLSKVVTGLENNECGASMVRSCCLQTSNAIDDIIDYWSIMNGSNLDMLKSSSSMGQIVEEVLEMYEEDMNTREILPNCAWEMEEYEKVCTDVSRVKRVLSTLMSLTLAHTLHSPVHLQMSYYDTRQETILFVLSHKDSFMSEEVIQLLMEPPQSPQNFNFNLNNQVYKMQTGKILQIMLSVALIERLGPPGSLNVRKDDKSVEISFRMYTNLAGGRILPAAAAGVEESYRPNVTLPQFISFSLSNNQFVAEQNQLQHRSQSQLLQLKRGSKHQYDMASFHMINQLTETNSMRNILSPVFQQNGSYIQQINTMVHIPSTGQIPQSDTPVVATPVGGASIGAGVGGIIGLGGALNPLESGCLLTEEIMEKYDEKPSLFYRRQSENRDIGLRTTRTDVEMSSGGPIAGLKFGGGTFTTLAEKYDNEIISELDSMLNKKSVLLVDSDANSLSVLQKFKNLELQVVSDLTIALQNVIARHLSAQSANSRTAASASSAASTAASATGIITVSSGFYSLILVNMDESARKAAITAEEVKRVALYLKNVLGRSIPVILLSSVLDTKQLIDVQSSLVYVQLPLTIDKLAKALRRNGSITSTQTTSLPSLLFQ